MTRALLFLLAVGAANCLAFGGGEDRFVRKFAMMKVYESCFGPEVVKEVRKEMRAACSKCAAFAAPTAAPQQEADKRRPSAQFDPGRLQQAILGFKQHQAAPVPAPASQFTQFTSGGYYPAQPVYYPGGGNNLYGPQPVYSMYPQPAPAFYPGYYPGAGQRVARDLDLRGQLEALTSRIGGRVRNVTCVMQELGYLDENLEPSFQRIVERINRLPVAEELKRDMVEGVEFCQKFSQCVPELREDKFPLSRELVKPMFFFKCYKHKKLEACVMKDVRERYQPEELGAEDEAELRSFSGQVDQDDQQDIVTGMYDFLFGAGGPDGDTLF